MDSIFLIKPKDYFIGVSNLENSYLCDVDATISVEDILDKYRKFRSKTKGLSDSNNLNWIYLAYVRSSECDQEKFDKVFEDFCQEPIIQKDIKQLFLINILNCLTFEEPDSFRSNTIKLVKNSPLDRIYSILFSKENLKANEITSKELNTQVNNFLKILFLEPRTVVTNLKPSSKKKELIQNSFGSSEVIIPIEFIKNSFSNLNLISQCYYMLKESRLSKSLFLDLSSDFNEECDYNQYFEENFCSDLSTLGVVQKSNYLFNKLKIEDISNSFSNLSLGEFSQLVFNENCTNIGKLSKSLDNLLNGANQEDTINSFELSNNFFDSISNIFRDYQNNNLISFQDQLNFEKSKKTDWIVAKIDKFILDFINEKKFEKFSDSTRLEMLIKILDYISFGEKNSGDEIQSDLTIQSRINDISNKSYLERKKDRSNSTFQFKQKQFECQKQISNIDEKLEDAENEESFNGLAELRAQLNFRVIDNDISVFNLDRYSFIQKVSFFSLTIGILLFISFFKLLGFLDVLSTLKYSVLIGSLPVLYGFVHIYQKYVQFKNNRKKVKELISNKLSLFNRVIENYENFISRYFENFKNELTINIFKDIQYHCKNKIRSIWTFRRSVYESLATHIKSYEDSVFNSSAFEFSLISKDEITDHFFKYPIPLYFDEEAKKSEYFDLISRSFNHIETLRSPELNLSFFNEDLFFQKNVQPLIQHIDMAEYHNNFELSPHLFIGTKNRKVKTGLLDVKQGEIGNCYFMSCLASIANSNPAFVHKMVSKSENKIDTEKKMSKGNSFLVRFFSKNGSERFVEVDDKFWFYNKSKNPVYANFGTTDSTSVEIWPMVLEKAWATINNGYEEIVGSNEAFRELDFGQTLTGNKIDYHPISSEDKSEILNELLANNFISDIPTVLYSKNVVLDINVQAAHAYTLESVDKNYINLYNPHGENHIKGLSMSSLIENFDAVLSLSLKEVTNLKTETIIAKSKSILTAEIIEKFEKLLPKQYNQNFLTRIMHETNTTEALKDILKKMDVLSSPLYSLDKSLILQHKTLVFADEKELKSIISNIDFENKPQIMNKISEDVLVRILKIISWNYS